MKMRGWMGYLVVVVALGAVGISAGYAVAEDPTPPSWGTGPVGVEPFNAESSALRMVGGLFLCLGLLGAGVHLYKRYVLPRTVSDRRRMQIVERLNISQKSALLLVALDGREFLLSTGAESCRVVSAPREGDELFAESLSGACEDEKEFNA